MRAIGWMALAATVTLAACGDDNGSTGPGPGNPGSSGFSAKVSGDVQVPSVKGAALFGTAVDEAQGEVFGLEMSESGSGGSLIQIVRLGGQVPAVGTYDIKDALNTTPGSGDFVATAFDTDNGQPAAIFVATGGTLKVTQSSATAFKGTFTFDAQGGLFSDPETTLNITVEGTFNASPATGAIQITSLRTR